MLQINIQNSIINLSHNEFGYKEVLEDFQNATHVNIVTYNISKKESDLIKKLKELNNNVNVNIISNIPNRFRCLST